MMPMPHLPAVTLASLLQFAGALLWCAVLFVAIAGYGAALLRLCRVRRPGLAFAASVGMGLSVLIGGVLNLLHAITRPALLGFLAAGLLAGAAALLGRRSSTVVVVPTDGAREPSHRRWTPAGLACLAGFLFFLCFRLGASVHTPYYQPSDDYNFYLAAPVKMLETHIFGADPYSERRVMSSVGGNHFLEVLVLTELPLADVQMADRTLGLLLTALLAWGIAREFGLSRTDSAAFALFCLATPQLQFNLTFVVLPSALFFAMVYVAVREAGLEGRSWLRGLLLGLLIGAATSMKSTYVAHAAAFALCFGWVHYRSRGGAATVRLLAGVAAGSIAVLLPWMIVNRWAAGTYFYPTLGLGDHYSRWGGFPPPGGTSLSLLLRKVVPFALPLFAIFALEWRFGPAGRPKRVAMAMTLAAAIGTLLVGFATGGDSVRRYNYPALLPGVLLVFPVICGRSGEAAKRLRGGRAPRFLAAAIAAATALYVGFNPFTHEYAWAVRCFRTSLTSYRVLPNEVLDPAEGDRIERQYRALQAAIPPGGAVIETLTDPYLLDFGQREIFLADVPGAASPPPGWPARQSGQALAKFLLAHGIRYLAYSYADGASETDNAAHNQMLNAHNTQWIRSEAAIVLAAHHQYEELGRSRRRIYDDGQRFVLDLAEPLPAPAPAAVQP